jgi:hypothetical protein
MPSLTHWDSSQHNYFIDLLADSTLELTIDVLSAVKQFKSI